MTFVKIYTGPEGESHFGELELTLEPVDPSLRGAFSLESSTATFHRFPTGPASDWHTASRRQYVVVLAGEMEIEVGGGDLRRFGPGDMFLDGDVAGRGHLTRVLGNSPLIVLAIPEP